MHLIQVCVIKNHVTTLLEPWLTRVSQSVWTILHVDVSMDSCGTMTLTLAWKVSECNKHFICCNNLEVLFFSSHRIKTGPCQRDPCSAITNAVEHSCTAHSSVAYSCRCEIGYAWDMSIKACSSGTVRSYCPTLQSANFL